MNANEYLAHWAANVSNKHTPMAIECASNAIIDTIACMLIGYREPVTQHTLTTVANWGYGHSTVIGHKHSLPAPWAALVNGTSAHAIDFDDYNEIPSFMHPSAVLLPALLAIAEENHKSGLEVLDAFIVGIEIVMRIGEAVNTPHYNLGWHATATIGVLGAAVACARLLGLKAEAISVALSIATSHAAGYNSQFGTMTKPLHVGFAAQAGVLAAQLAAKDITASTATLDGKWSFLTLLSTKAASGFEIPLAKLGQKLAIEEYGLSVKRYPCCSAIHRAIDGLLILRNTYHLSPTDITTITITIQSSYVDMLPFVFPKNDAQARFSMAYCIATTLLTGDLQPNDFTLEAIQRSEVQVLIPLVSMEKHAITSQNQPDIVTIQLKNGQIIKQVVETAIGMPDSPLSKMDLFKKFNQCAQGVLTKAQCNNAQEFLKNFKELEEIIDLMDSLKGVMHV